MRGDGSLYLRGSVYWMAFYHGKQTHRESTGCMDEESARNVLARKMKEVHAAQLGGPQLQTAAMRRLTVSDLLAWLKDKYESKGKASAQNLSHLRRADSDLGHLSATASQPKYFAKHFAAYKQQRFDAGDAPASVNRILQMVRAAFRLAVKGGELTRAPFIELADESGNEREGFFSEEETQAVLAHLPSDGLADFVEWLSETGMRCGEAQGLTWAMVHGEELHVPGKIAKNGKPRVIPLGATLARIIERRRKARRVVSLDGNATLAEPIFHRGDGKRVGEFRKSWHSACVAAGVGKWVCATCQTEGTEKTCPKCKRTRKYAGRIAHDFRRSCARRLLAAGVPRQIARKFTGHKTDSMFDRYAIVDAALLLGAQDKVAAFRKRKAQ